MILALSPGACSGRIPTDHAPQRPPPETTIARVLARRDVLGLTRLADITGLDRIGIPVVLSVRPAASYLSVDAGKGISLAHARASAAMECVERHAGETARLPSWRESYLGCARKRPTVAGEALPLSHNSLFSDSLPIDWTLAWDMVGQQDVALPLEMVVLDRVRRGGRDVLAFQTGSNGLSAGNSLSEAVFGGLCELVERDAIACMRRAWERHGQPPPRLCAEAVTDGVNRELLDRYRAAGIEAVIFDCRSDIDLPVYMVYLVDRHTPEFGLFRGYGCHPNVPVALQRALTEAAQSRLVTIAGSRDDLFGHNRILGRSNYDAAAEIVLEAAQQCARAVDGSPELEDTTGGIDLIIERLGRAGLNQVLVADLTAPDVGIPAVRVIVPGLEGYIFESYSPGPRARQVDARMEGQP